jgi:hypothetical protein
MKHHKEIAESSWFALIGDKLLILAVLAFLLPFLFAFQLMHAGHLKMGIFLLAIWTIADGVSLWHFHRHNYLRLLISLPCTLLGVGAAFLIVWGA